MTRTISSGLLAAISSASSQPFLAVELLFDSGALRLWTGYGPRVIDSETYTGTGVLMRFDGLEEVSQLEARSATVTLSGIPNSIVSIALQEPYQGRTGRILFGDRSTSDVAVVFSGLIDVMPIRDGPEVSTIAVTIESKLVELERPRIRRYTQESQQALHAGDTFFSFVADLVDKEIPWGRKSG